MTLSKVLIALLLPLFSLSRLYAVESIDNTNEHLFFLDNSSIYKYDLLNNEFRKKITIFNDSALINGLFRTVGLKKGLPLSAIQNRFRAANYFNLTVYENKIYIAGMFYSVDTSEKNWDYIILEYSENLQFRNFYLLQEPQNYRYGFAEPYPRFKMQFGNSTEVMFTVITPPTEETDKTKEPVFAIFKMDPKKSELRFSRPVNIPRPPREMKTIVIFHSRKPKVYFPINIPISFSDSPAYFSFPYVIVRNYNRQNTFDPFHQTQYSIDSSYQLDGNFSGLPVGQFLNTLNTRELILAYKYDNEKLRFILRDYAGKENTVVLMSISGSAYTITPLKMVGGDLNRLYFHFIGDNILTVRKVKDEFYLQYLE